MPTTGDEVPGPGGDPRLHLLAHGRLEVHDRLPDASNTSVRATVRLGTRAVSCVYKPVSGERPLWDFPDGTLARRETAAYLLSRAAGWDVVPPTVLRDGPLGPGSVQCWLAGRDGTDRDPDPPEPGAGLVGVLPVRVLPPGWRPVLVAEDPDGGTVALAHSGDGALRRLTVFDVVANNADRKGGHVLRDGDGPVLGIDHGLTFHAEDKLRTVLWGFAGEPLTATDRRPLERVVAGLADGRALRERLSPLLSSAELDRTRSRAGTLLAAGRFPLPPRERPAIPWPAI